MRINHNLAALNTYNKLTGNTVTTSKSLEKLSSGLRINRAGDDAAGLAISEKMRGQIRGLDQASRNSQDGISMIQTAEGALAETESILQRMRELAVQSANGTNADGDRAEIQKEINQLTSEINRIGNTTEFNTMKLLNGGGVDPTKVTKGGIISVPATLSGGVGSGVATVQIRTGYQITEALTDAVGRAAADGRTVNFTIGDKELTLTLNNGLNASNSTSTEVGIANVTTAADLASAIETALVEAFKADSYLTDNYQVNVAADAIVSISAKAYDFGGGRATGLEAGTYGNISIQTNISHLAETANQTLPVGSTARGSVDFTGKTGADLTGTSLWIDGKEIAFYDSSKGQYSGSAAFRVDMNDATTGEAIVDRIVNEMFNKTTGSDTKAGYAAPTNESYLERVDLFKDSKNGSILQMHADVDETASLTLAGGALGNDISVMFDAPVNVTSTVDSILLSGESVTSAKGLEDGLHTIKITYSAAKATEGAVAGDATASITVAVPTTTNFESGIYRLTNSGGTAAGTAGIADLQKLGADGVTWTTVAGYDDITLSVGTTQKIGDITLTATTVSFTAMTTVGVAGTDSFEFNILKQGYTAALQEANDASTTWGPFVSVESGQKGVTLGSNDGIGSVTFDVGDISNKLVVGAYTEVNFVTSGTVNADISGGTFQAKLQIGANMGQSFTMDIGDMRSQALQVSGVAAATTAGGVTGAKYTATKVVTNGSDNTSTEFALDVTDHDKATAAIKVLDNAITAVSAQRSQLGAYQNRLEHTINNLGTTSENLTGSESRIRDVDMAKEMMEFTKNNILSQAAQAMLAQANQQPQGVLQLLR